MLICPNVLTNVKSTCLQLEWTLLAPVSTSSYVTTIFRELISLLYSYPCQRLIKLRDRTPTWRHFLLWRRLFEFWQFLLLLVSELFTCQLRNRLFAAFCLQLAQETVQEQWPIRNTYKTLKLFRSDITVRNFRRHRRRRCRFVKDDTWRLPETMGSPVHEEQTSSDYNIDHDLRTTTISHPAKKRLLTRVDRSLRL